MKRLFATALLFTALLAGCSKSSQEGSLIDSSGHHAAGWATVTGGDHAAAYLARPGLCNECHGNPSDPNGSGGISGVSCFSASFGALSCHPAGPGGHAAGFASPDVHGLRAKSAASGANGMAFCQNCHGRDYRGAGSASDCIGCHRLAHPGSNAPHSPLPWRGGARTHTNTDPSNAAACAQCHTAGANLTASLRLTVYQTGTPGCFNQTLCHGQVGHADTSTFPAPTLPWTNPTNHGARARYQPNQNDGFSLCQSCHGSDFAGGSSGVGCLSTAGCHGVPAPHPSTGAWRFAAGSVSHVNTDQVDPALSDAGTSNAAVCAACHNAATGNLSEPFRTRFAASSAGSFNSLTPGCFNASLCHGDIKNDCSVCHGYSNGTASTPFQSLSGATAPTDPKVGAHAAHLHASGHTAPFATAISSDIGCAQCHPVPASPAPSGSHRDGSTEIEFGGLATGNGSVSPVVTASSGSFRCANVYCHGATLSGGSNTTPRWNDTGYLASPGCGTCHGFPPATTAHSAVSASTACAGCHPHVNTANTGFVDPGKHINGAIDVSGGASHSFPYPGSAHKSATLSGCLACHLMSGSTNPYPPGAGTPPNCRSCHLNANPTTAPHCSDCHGDATTGRPNGSVFPNKAGRHSSPGAHAQSCPTCHAGGGTGVASHGNSNNGVKTAADVVLNATGVGMTITRNGTTGAITCSGSCHGENHGTFPAGRRW